jgi:uncharacterized membrane protein YbaN (DUF454 family)
MSKKKPMLGRSLSGKVIACVVVPACVVVGAAGLVLPIIPGLLFLAIAAFIAAKHFPWVDTRLRRHRVMGKHLNNADRFRNLSLPEKVQVGGWLSVKMLVDGLAYIRSFVAKLGAALRYGPK